MSIKRAEYRLSNDNIDLISSKALADMALSGVVKEHQIKTRFSLEEALLRMQEHFGAEATVSVSSFRRFGRHYIDVRLAGEAYNPLRFSESEFEEWNQILTYADYQPDFQYSGHTNLIRWAAPVSKKHPAVISGIAILLGLVIGILGKLASTNETVMSAITAVLSPVVEIWIRLLNVLCGPVVFLLIITTVLNLDSITRQGDSTGKFMGRTFRMSFISAVFAIFACIFALPNVRFGGFRNTASDLQFLLLEMVPEDIFAPFASSNVPQLLLLGIVIGSAIAASGKKYRKITGLIHEANGLGIHITEGMSNIAPYFLCILLIYEIVVGHTASLINMWQPVLMFIVISYLIMMLFTIIVARREGVDPAGLARALNEPFTDTVRSGSAYGVLENTLKNCSERLGIDRQYAKVALKIGLIMYMPISAAGTLIFVIYTASMYDASFTLMWYVMACVVAVAMSLAVPPVPGVGILTYVVMFAQLGIPSQALIAAMVFDVLTSFIITAANQYMLQLELILSADRMAMINYETLRTVPPKQGKKD